jgi:hypothetical protein
MAEDGSIPLDLRIAVTGHRALADTAAATAAIDVALDLITSRIRPAVRARCRLVAVSALADGADRLVADRVLAQPRSGLEVILPMPKAAYVPDFDPVSSLPEFERLLAEASWLAIITGASSREDAYAKAGHAIADRADITIAIWDGQPAAGKGGTGDIVGYLRAGQRPWIWICLSDGGAEVTAENMDALGDVSWLGMSDAELRRLDEYNQAPLDAGQSAALRSGLRHSMEDGSGALPVPAAAHYLDWIGPYFSRAEQLSRRYQRRYMRLASALFVLAALAVCVVGVQLVFFPQTRWLVSGEIACLVAILCGLDWGRRHHLQRRWISARYLAERLRSAIFIALAEDSSLRPGAPAFSIADAADSWVTTAFSMAWARRPQGRDDGVPIAALRAFLSRAWIENQGRYFAQAYQDNWSKHRISSRAVAFLFGLSLVTAVIHLVLGGPEDWFHHAVALAAICIPACAAALVGHNTQREYLRNALRYRRMAQNLARTSGVMLAAASRAQVWDAISAVDRTLQQEHGDWFGTVGIHDLELPA